MKEPQAYSVPGEFIELTVKAVLERRPPLTAEPATGDTEAGVTPTKTIRPLQRPNRIRPLDPPQNGE